MCRLLHAVLCLLCALGLGLPAQAQGPGAGKQVESWIQELGDPDPEVRRNAVVALLGQSEVQRELAFDMPAAQAALVAPILIEILQDANREVRLRSNAAAALGYVVRAAVPGQADSAAVPALVAALSDHDRGLRLEAARGLALIGPPAAPATPLLVEWLKDEDEIVRSAASLALSRIGPAALPLLIQALQSGPPRVRVEAATSIALMGPPAVSATPHLIEALRAGPDSLRSEAAFALGRLGSPAAVSPLVEALEDEAETVRFSASNALGELPAHAAPALRSLVDLRGEMSALGRDPALSALRKIGQALKAQGKVPWWVLPYAYRGEGVALLLLLVGWFALAARLSPRRSTSKLGQAALFAFTAAVPCALACGAVGYAITREWAQDFLPGTVISVLPFHVSAVLSVGFACLLPAVWVCWRKRPVAHEEIASLSRDPSRLPQIGA